MKISLNWIKEYVNVTINPEELAERLTMAGLEVESIHEINDDIILEIEVTPNRADCLNMRGMAREIAAILNKPLKISQPKKARSVKKRCDVSIENNKACPRYNGTLIENVHIKDSSGDTLKKSSSLGGRAVNNAVDITNICLMDMGQPLHVFDYDKLEGKKIAVRFAKSGEKIITLDGIERQLDPTMLVIADAKKPVAIAGVMGGKNAEVTASTKNILLESANFDPILIRRTAKKLALSTDSSYRFERGINLQSVEQGANQAAALIIKSAGGKVAAQTDAGVKAKTKTASIISVTIDGINAHLGTKLSVKECQNILKRLGFAVTVKAGKISAKAPIFRRDISQPVDIIEEVARIIGFNNLPSSLPAVQANNMPLNRKYAFKKELAQHLLAQGYSETVTFAMYDEGKLKRSNLDLPFLKIRNPLSNDQQLMRPSLLPSLLSVVVTNINQGQKALRFFETGKIYAKHGERDTLALITCGTRHQDWREAKKPKIDFYDLKGALEHVLGRILPGELTFSPLSAARPQFEGTDAAVILYNREEVGEIGQINESVARNWSVEQRAIFYAQIDLEKIYGVACKKRFYQLPGEYPAIVRDLSLGVKPGIVFADVRKTIADQKEALLKKIIFQEEYLGDKIETGFRGIVFSLYYQSDKRTLREEEVHSANEKIVAALIKDLGVIRR